MTGSSVQNWSIIRCRLPFLDPDIPMQLRFPIPARLLAGFLANLALLALGFWLAFQAQFGSSSNQLFESIAEPRVQAVAERVSAALRAEEPSRWNGVLEMHTHALGVEFSLFDGEHRNVAGPLKDLPDSVKKDVMGELTPHLLDRVPEGPRPQEEPPPFDDIFGLPPPPQPRGERPPRRDPHPMNPELSTYPKVTAHTTGPTAYWVVCRVPVVRSDRGWLPLLLVMRSPSLTGGGLFFDPKPWLYAGAAVLLVSGLIWLPMALGLTRSLWRIRSATGRIAEGDFAVSVPDSRRGDELGDLGRAVQQMAQRLEAHVTGQKRFLGDIAHELCSPIARMQASLGILEHAAEDEARQKRYMQKLGGELQHMSTLVNELLSFSKASLKREISPQAVVLAPLVRQVLEREEAMGAGVTVEVPDELAVRADPELLGRAVGNLVRNALRYAGDAGPIGIRAVTQNGHVLLTVRDQGPGVPDETLPRLFDPFFRPDAARSRESGGAGLGLAIVKTCVEACGGTVAAANATPHGLEVSLKLEAARWEGESS